MKRPDDEWNAPAYHRVSDPQFRWGLEVLGRLSLRGDEVALDAGCGTGRLTAELLQRLPAGKVFAVDVSAAMLDQARAFLAPRFGEQVRFLQADLAALRAPEPLDVIFSTATFHWVLDQDALYRALFASLRPSGRLHAQCGGGDNLKRTYGRAERILGEPRYKKHFARFQHPTCFAWPDETRGRLAAAGFQDIFVELVEALTVLPDADSYRAFLETVILRVPLGVLASEPGLQQAFLDRMVKLGESDDPPFSLDYWRLNVAARRPA